MSNNISGAERARLTSELLPRAQAGDIKARNQLIELHMPLVAKMAKAYKRPALEADLIQAGIAGGAGKPLMGLCRAIRDFDQTRGVTFSTYAVPWIRLAMQHELVDNGTGCVRINRSMRRIRKLLQECADRLETSDPEQLAEALSQQVNKKISSMTVRRAQEAIDTGITEFDGVLPEQLIERPEDAEHWAERHMQWEKLEPFFDRLKPIEKSAVLFIAEEGVNQTEIARKLGISRQAVSLIVLSALAKLRLAVEWR